MYVIFPYVYKAIISSEDETEKIIRTINMIFYSVIAALLFYTQMKGYYLKIEIMLTRIPSFILGVYIGDLSYNKREITIKNYMIFIVGLFAYYLRRLSGDPMIARYLMAISNISMYSLAIVFIERTKHIKPINLFANINMKMFTLIGCYSLEVYLIHVALIKLFNKFHIPSRMFKYELLLVVITMILSIIINALTNTIINYKKKYL